MEGISESFHLRSRIAEDYFQVFKSWKLLIVGLADEADAAFDKTLERRSHGDRSGKIAFRLGSHSLLQSEKSTIDVSFGIVWINLDGFSEIGDCTLHIPFCYFCNSAVVVRHNVLRVGCHSLIEIGQRTIQIALIETEISTVVPGRR